MLYVLSTSSYIAETCIAIHYKILDSFSFFFCARDIKLEHVNYFSLSLKRKNQKKKLETRSKSNLTLKHSVLEIPAAS